MSHRRKERLRREASKQSFYRRTARAAISAMRRPGGIAIAGCALALFTFIGLLNGNVNQESDAALAPKRYAELHEPQGAEIMSRPDTVVYSMSHGGEGPLEGGLSAPTKQTVWINVRTHEVFLLLEGMLPSEQRDVQAWASYGDRDANLGLLQFHQGQAHLYAADVQPELWDSLELTIEPKGGSDHPTSPRTAALLLLRELRDMQNMQNK
nr:anti-sigma factor [Cohnella lubricantis]